MLDPAEKKEIIDGIRYEFKTFKDDTFKPIADAVKANTDINSAQRAHIVENRVAIKSNQHSIKKVSDGVKENRGSIGRLFLWIIGVLITIAGGVFALWLTGTIIS